MIQFIKPKLYLSDILNAEDPSTMVDDTSIITIDDDIQNKSKGLFGKTMRGEVFLKLYSHQGDNESLTRQAKRNFLISYKANKENATIFPLNLPSDNLMNYLYACQTEKRCLKSKICFDTQQECKKTYDSLYSKHLMGWITREQFEQIWDESYSNLLENSVQNEERQFFIPNDIVSGLKRLHYLFENAKIEIHNGHAGCGKSTSVMEICNRDKQKKCVIVSLSNTICNMFKQKVPHITTCSCSKAQFLFDLKKANIFEEADIIVMDEFSQWGFEWLPLLNNILSSNERANFYIMGDIDQIPTFLSSGSLLYSLMAEFPNKTIQHNTQFRFANVPHYRELVNDILNNKIPPNTMISSINDAVLDTTDCFITGTNNNVDLLNKLMLKHKHNIDNDDLYNVITQTGGDVPLIASSTTEINDTKIYCNTRYSVKTITRDYVVLASCVDGSLVKCGYYDIRNNFKLAYAITVNKAQGLEWENVCCYITSRDRNLKTFNALYVALTRGKQNIIIASDDNGKGMSVGDLQNILNIKYKFQNNFKEVEKINER